MYKSLLMIMLIMISGCKDKYERILDEVSDTSMSVRKCELKKLASEKPEFACKKSSHKIAIEKARALGIKENRISAAVNVGILQTDQDSLNLIKKGKFLKIAEKYQAEAERNQKSAAGIPREIESHINGEYAGYSPFDVRTPNECKREESVFAPTRRWVTINNKNFNENECRKQLIEYQTLYEKAANIWAEKAIGWEKAAMKIKSEY